MDIVRVILSILLPPLGVFLQVGFGFHFWINILLTLLGYVPGLIHAVWIIATRPLPTSPSAGIEGSTRRESLTGRSGSKR